MNDESMVHIRKLENQVFRFWYDWLFQPDLTEEREEQCKEDFKKAIAYVEQALHFEDGPYFHRDFGLADVIFAPILERMNASLFYYKGYDMKRKHPKIGEWFDAMETR